MTEKSNLGLTLVVSALICGLILGAIFGVQLFPKTVEKVVTVEKKVEVPVEKIVTVEKNVTVDTHQDWINKVVKEFLSEVEDNDNLQVCDGETYDFDQITVSKVYDGATVSTNSDRHGDTTTVNTEVKLKYADKDVESKCYKTFNVSVDFEDGEDPVLNWD